ncbi:MAG: GAF domain-containing protein, partial [Desulfatitalea sp.]|nr:GAF domain-containing protein [Desulfatitalea sp.]
MECWAGCNLPAGYAAAGNSQGHICNETIQKTELEPVAFEDLSQTPYAQSDPAIRRHGFKSYLGHPVVCKGKTVGSLCILDTRQRVFTDVDTYIISTLARSLALEEERKLAEKEQLRLTARLQ